MAGYSNVLKSALANIQAIYHERDVKANRVRKQPKKRSDAHNAVRPLCAARCRSGEPCRARVCVRPDGRAGKRCRMHGGLSTGPKSLRPLTNDTPQTRAALLHAFSRGATVASAAKFAGISPNSYYRICARDPAFRRACWQISPRY